MKKHIIEGYVRLTYNCRSNTNFIALDINNLEVSKIWDRNDQEIQFEIQKNTKNSIGDALIIYSEGICANNNNYLDIYYKTKKGANGVNFSNPENLHDKNYTFLYTHGEAIYSRTFFPSQDTPSLKVKVSAKIIIDKPYTVLFSGKLTHKKDLDGEKTEYFFEMDKPIPTYLITFAAGKLVHKTIPNSRCEFYGEEESLKFVDESFSNCEYLLKFYEKYGDFFLEKLIFLIAPDDFPYSGMANPYVSIISESVLSKDMFFSSDISHNIAHFWSGNLVTQINWSSLWLNEGITTYLTRKSLMAVFGEEQYSFDMNLGLENLDKSLEEFRKNPRLNARARSLTPDFNDDPYIMFSKIPNEKGSFFMLYLENLLGEDTMRFILTDYFKDFAFMSIGTEDFVNFFKSKLILYSGVNYSRIIDSIEWDKWLKGTEGLPISMKFNVDRKKKIQRYYENIVNGITKIDEVKSYIKNNSIGANKRLFMNVIQSFNSLHERVKDMFKEIIKDPNIFQENKTIISEKIILTALFKNNADDRIEYLKEKLKSFPYYKVYYLIKIFSLMNDKKSDRKLLTEILEEVSDRLNPIAFNRVKEYIEDNTE